MTVHVPNLGKRIAIIIDAENVPFPAAEKIVVEQSNGTVRLIAVADWSSPSVDLYAKAPPQFGIRLLHCFPKKVGKSKKSRSDFAICGEAVAALNSNEIDEVVILSSDQDFDAFIASCGYSRRLKRIPPSLDQNKIDSTRESARKPLEDALRANSTGISLNDLGKSLKCKAYGFSRLSKLANHFPDICELRDGKVYPAERPVVTA